MTRKEAERFVGTIETIFTDCPWGYEAIGVNLYAPGSPFEHIVCPKNEHGDCMTDDCPCEGGGEYWKTPRDWPAFLREILAALAPPAASETMPLSVEAEGENSSCGPSLASPDSLDASCSMDSGDSGSGGITNKSSVRNADGGTSTSAPPAASEPETCDHGHLRRSCELCERDAEIERLKAREEATAVSEREGSAAYLELLAAQDRLRSELSALREGVRTLCDQRTAHGGSYAVVTRDGFDRLAALVEGKP